MSNFFRGISAEQDGRYKKADEVLRAKMTKAGKFSNILDKKIEFDKVNIDIIARWVTEKITELLGFEDEIVINMIVNLLRSKVVDAKKLQMDITGFLSSQAKDFMDELWSLLVDAQSQPSGIPSVFLQRKREEILSRISDSNRNDKNQIEDEKGSGKDNASNSSSGSSTKKKKIDDNTLGEDVNMTESSNVSNQRKVEKSISDQQDVRDDHTERKLKNNSNHNHDSDNNGDYDDNHKDKRHRDDSRRRSRGSSRDNRDTYDRSRDRRESRERGRERERYDEKSKQIDRGYRNYDHRDRDDSRRREREPRDRYDRRGRYDDVEYRESRRNRKHKEEYRNARSKSSSPEDSSRIKSRKLRSRSESAEHRKELEEIRKLNGNKDQSGGSKSVSKD